MTAAAKPPVKTPAHWRLVAIVAVAVFAAAGLGAGLAGAFGAPSSPPETSSSFQASTAGSAASYSYYRSVMGRYGFGPSSMMGGSSYGWMMGRSGYRWMTGGAHAPGWMTGGRLPGFMMGGGTDPGTIMGSLFANAPGPRINESVATRLGDQVPAGATLNRAANRLTFTTTGVHFAVLASPSMPAENFRVAGLTDPSIVVPAGAHVTIEFINADEDMAHGLVITDPEVASSPMPMMAAAPVFPGAGVWFLGESTSAGMHEAAVTFSASTRGDYRYVCPVPGHAQEGMAGTFIVK